MKQIAAVAVFLAVIAYAAAADNDIDAEFSAFERRFGKVYSSPEERAHRMRIFGENVASFDEHNRSGRSWRKGVTKFADITSTEIKSQLPSIP